MQDKCGTKTRAKTRTKAADQPGLLSAAVKYQPTSQMLLYRRHSVTAKANFKGGIGWLT